MGAARPNSVWVVVQARSDSTRFPGKVLAALGSHPLLAYVMGRARRVAPTCLAIPFGDSRLHEACAERGWTWFGGPEHDVLRRYSLAAKRLDTAHVVRVTADCPFIDVEAARWTVQHHLESGADFTHHIAEGRGIEVFTRDALDTADRLASSAFDREHPDEYILSHPRDFHIELMKFSVDTPADLDLARRRLNGPHILVS